MKEGFKEVFRIHSPEEVQKLIHYFKEPTESAALQSSEAEIAEEGGL